MPKWNRVLPPFALFIFACGSPGASSALPTPSPSAVASPAVTASPSPTQTPSPTAVGFTLPAGCSYAGAPVVGTGGSQWKFDCGSAANDNARGALAPALAAQAWTSCGVGLGSGTWMKGDLRLIGAEGSGGPAPAGLPVLTQPTRGVGTACGSAVTGPTGYQAP